uniref:Nonribosomal peptide synthetase (PCP) n=1 Tax=Prochloron didemni P3-Solomon TaxID=910458 RepID=G0XS82_PRODI|nr:nonribosomal peptide synthetase (PCP) [Prochloron didemni P3-Solomon]
MIWSNILDLDEIGIDDNFFELGGNSLSVVQITTEIAKVFKINLSISILFEATTIRDLAKIIAGQKKQPITSCLCHFQFYLRLTKIIPLSLLVNKNGFKANVVL